MLLFMTYIARKRRIPVAKCTPQKGVRPKKYQLLAMPHLLFIQWHVKSVVIRSNTGPLELLRYFVQSNQVYTFGNLQANSRCEALAAI